MAMHSKKLTAETISFNVHVYVVFSTIKILLTSVQFAVVD